MFKIVSFLPSILCRDKKLPTLVKIAVQTLHTL